jgi:hypothetical protein
MNIGQLDARTIPQVSRIGIRQRLWIVLYPKKKSLFEREEDGKEIRVENLGVLFH